MEPIVFNYFDYLVIGLIILSGFIAFFRGFIQESLSLLLWVIAFATSMFLDVYLDPYFLDYIQSPEIRRILIIILVFVGIIFLGGFLIKVIRSLVHWSGMGGLDRLLGVLIINGHRGEGKSALGWWLAQEMQKRTKKHIKIKVTCC